RCSGARPVSSARRSVRATSARSRTATTSCSCASTPGPSRGRSPGRAVVVRSPSSGARSRASVGPGRTLDRRGNADYPGSMTTTSDATTTTAAPHGATTAPPAGPSSEVTAAVHEIARRAQAAAPQIATATRAVKDAALHALADALVERADAIVTANAEDLERGRQNGMSPGLLDRLTLTPERIAGIADALRELAALPDPVGEVVRGSTLPNGLRLTQTRVPMGVVGMIYEARPNVTVDAAGLGLKSGNAVILRGGSAAASSNSLIVKVLGEALEAQGLPADLVQSIDEFGRAGAVALMGARGLVDLLVPRGGADLISTVVRESKVPVVETGTGN